MRLLIFDTETTGLPKKGNKSKPDPMTWPHVCQLSWLVFDDVTEKLFTKDYIIRLPEGVTIPKKKLKVTTGGSASYIFQVACRIKSN